MRDCGVLNTSSPQFHKTWVWFPITPIGGLSVGLSPSHSTPLKIYELVDMSYSLECELCNLMFVANTWEQVEAVFLEHLTKCHTREEILTLKNLASKELNDLEGYKTLKEALLSLEHEEFLKRDKKVG